MKDTSDRRRQRNHARTTNVDARKDIHARTTDLFGRGSDIRLQATASDLRADTAATEGEAPRGDASRTTLVFSSGSSHAADPPVSAGSEFAGKYRLERVLGRGAVGVVYLARDLSLERDVAVKILRPAHAADARIASSFRHEAVSMASVRHVNVVRIYTSGQWDGLLFFVMEYVPGRSVAALIQQLFGGGGGGIPSDTLLGIVDDVCLGLGALHERGIFHGDVKPGNMLIDHSNHVAITDFGLGGSSVAAIGDIERVEANPHHSSGGTPLYVAPELIVGKVVPPEDRHLCDVYSLGASVFEMFTGRGPYAGRTIDDLLNAHISSPAPELTKLRPDLPAALDPVLRKALAKQPRQRYSNCEDFAFAVNRAVRDHAA